MSKTERKVSRVLVMLEYGAGDPDNGEVFDITALVTELVSRSVYSASIKLDVRAVKSFAPRGDGVEPAPELTISWSGDAGGQWVFGASHLEDVVNAALPDGERVKDIKAKAERCRSSADSLDLDAMRAKLEQAASVRSQFPIARVTQDIPTLPSQS